MEVYLELNRRFGTGYQIRVLHGPVDKTYDLEPYTLYDAGQCADIAVTEFNKMFGTSFKTHQVMHVTEEGLKANAGRDFASAKMLKDIQSGQFNLSTPGGQDFTRGEVDGEEQCLLTGRGTILTVYFIWVEDKNPKAREGLLRYCQYIASHGYKGGATKALAELDAKDDKDAAVEWIKQSYARYVSDDAALIQFVLAQ